jgi:DNA primase catalytic core
MPRLPESEIDRIKQQTDLVALVRSRGVELHKHGSKDFAGKCPFHADDTPSFIVSPEKGLYHCMGCGAAGNAIQFVGKFDGVSFRHAFEILNAGPAAFSAPTDTPLKKATVPRLEAPVRADAGDAELFAQVVDYYHERLLATPGALDYLASRGLRHEEAIKRFRLGFADRTLGLRLPEANRKAGAEIRTRLQALGVIRESGHEHFNGSLVLPVFDAQGHVAEMYGRKVTDRLRAGTPNHLYLPGPHAGIWNEEALAESELILCEAPLDALTFWVNGFKNVTFIYGTEGFPDYLFEAILAKKVQRVRIAYDADDAGNRAAERDTQRLTAHGIEVFRVKFPWGMDANEYACKVTPPGKALHTVLAAAEWQKDPRTCTRGSSSPGPAAPPSPPVPAALPACPAKLLERSGDPEDPHVHTRGPSSSLLAAELAADEKKLLQDTTPRLDRAGEYHILHLGPREYRVGGLEKNNGLEVMKVAVRLKVEDLFHLDSFDMARDGERRRFIERAAEETKLEKELIKRDLGKLLLAMEQAQQERLASALNSEPRTLNPELSSAERSEALAFLKDPDLVEKIGAAFEACGLMGEGANRLAAYLACTSRKLGHPLAVIIQSTSAAGKSTLMEAVLSMFPEEERIKYSAMTGQSLYYLGESNLKHKILAVVEEEGAEKASYAMKLLQSEGELTIASTGKDPTTGRMETQEYHVEGPVMLFLTTTAVEIDEELLNRCLVLTVDESREQTERIHTLQRRARTLEGLVAKEEKKDLLRVLRNAQRLLQPLAIVNPFADDLTFTSDRTRTRRDHEKYLTLIDAIALLHQHQRPQETHTVNGRGVPFIRATLDDIALANRLAPELLGRGLDELPPQSRLLLGVAKTLVKALCKTLKVDQPVALFSRRDLQAACGWSYSQIKRHLFRLQELEYIAPRFGRMGSTLKYELLVDANEADDEARIGLLDVEKLRLRQPTWTGETATLTPPCQTPLARLSPAVPAGCVNLATLPERTSGARLAAAS